MVSFTSKLRQLTKIATERGVVDATTASALVTLAEQQEREGGVRSLSAILGALGGGTVALGVILLVAANWQGIGDWTKIGGLLLSLGGHTVWGSGSRRRTVRMCVRRRLCTAWARGGSWLGSHSSHRSSISTRTLRTAY